jgi:hypothetical protein
MKEMEWDVRHYFRVVLGEISVEELIKNRKLVKKAELINNLFLGTAL